MTVKPAPIDGAVDEAQAPVSNPIANGEAVASVPARDISQKTVLTAIRNTRMTTRTTEMIGLEQGVTVIVVRVQPTLTTVETIDERDPGEAKGERSDTTVIVPRVPAEVHRKGRNQERDTSVTTAERTKAEITGTIETHLTLPVFR